MSQVSRAMVAEVDRTGPAPEGRGGTGTTRHDSGTHRLGPPGPGNATILVVDDDEDVREAVSSALDDEGYDVLVARDGMDALAVLRRVPAPQLIVLDLTMPRMTGSEFRRHLAAELPQLSSVPVLVMSADIEGRLKARALGAAAFLRKPIRLSELFRTVSHHLRRSDVEPGA